MENKELPWYCSDNPKEECITAMCAQYGNPEKCKIRLKFLEENEEE